MPTEASDERGGGLPAVRTEVRKARAGPPRPPGLPPLANDLEGTNSGRRRYSPPAYSPIAAACPRMPDMRFYRLLHGPRTQRDGSSWGGPADIPAHLAWKRVTPPITETNMVDGWPLRTAARPGLGDNIARGIRHCRPTMPDTVLPPPRTGTMSQVRGPKTWSVRQVRSCFDRLGLRPRKDLPAWRGRPDVVFRRSLAPAFVRGHLWHQHAGCRGGRARESNAGCRLPAVRGVARLDSLATRSVPE